jgi:hypothetical protein
MMRFAFYQVGGATYGYTMPIIESVKWSFYNMLIAFTVLAILYGFFVPIISVLLAFGYFMWVKEERLVVCILGILLAVYMIVDYHMGYMGYLVWAFLFKSPNIYLFFVYLNFGMLFAYVFGLIFNLRGDLDERLLVFVTAVCLVLGLGLGGSILPKYVSPYDMVAEKAEENRVKEIEYQKKQEVLQKEYDDYWKDFK